MKKTSLVCFVSVLLLACNSINNPTLPENFLQLNFIPSDPLPGSTIKKVDFIQLQTTDENVIGDIKKLIRIENRLYILDDYKKLIVFDTTGKFLLSIGKKGRGPGEYEEVRDFAVYEEQIILLSYKKALFYDYHGNYLFARNFNWMAENITVKNEKEVYLFQNSNINKSEFVPYHIVKTNLRFKNGDPFLIPLKKEFLKPNRFQIYHDTVLLSAPQHFNNVILNVDNKNVSSYITLMFNNFKSPGNLGELTVTDKIPDYPVLVDSFIDENSIYFNFSFNERLYFGIYDKRSDEFYSGSRIEGSCMPIPDIKEIYENKIYASIDAYYLKQIIYYCLKLQKNMDDIFRIQLENLHNNITEGSNPIIITYTMN